MSDKGDVLPVASKPTASSHAQALPGIRLGIFFFPFKYIALILLLLQTTTVVLVMRYSLKPKSGDEVQYIKTTAVVMSELFKIVASVILLGNERRLGVFELFAYLNQEIVVNWRKSLLLGVPAGLYTLQNNLLFVALQNLDGATYQVTYQLKILTTALFSVTMLRKQLNSTKWISLLILTAGVACVQRAQLTSKPVETKEGSSFVGLTAVLAACCTSGFAGVYFEKILKGTKESVWLRNVQLALFSIVLGSIGCFYNDGDAIQENGFFQGYSNLVWIVVALQGLGGLVIATVIKYADNILKSFAVSISIIITGLVSYVFMGDFELTNNFFAGALLVMLATFLYGSDVQLCSPKVTKRPL
eukprot:m.70306 g.70306  ORF g.70306 m.70306 type:complete len:359 (-) comp24208_c2_seq1:51-1127(-)